MEQDRRDERRAAAMSFLEALDQLQETLAKSDDDNNKSIPTKSNKKERVKFDLSELEDAAADIDQFFQSLYPESSESKD